MDDQIHLDDYCPLSYPYIALSPSYILSSFFHLFLYYKFYSGSVMRLREEWLTCFARTLLFVLDQLPQPFMSINSTLVSGKCGNAISMIEFAPVLAEMFLEISMSFDFSSTREFDWIYTDLSKVCVQAVVDFNLISFLSLCLLLLPVMTISHLFLRLHSPLTFFDILLIMYITASWRIRGPA